MATTSAARGIPSTLPHVIPPPGQGSGASASGASACQPCGVTMQVLSSRVVVPVTTTGPTGHGTSALTSNFYTLQAYTINGGVQDSSSCRTFGYTNTSYTGTAQMTIPAQEPANFWGALGASFLSRISFSTCSGGATPTITVQEVAIHTEQPGSNDADLSATPQTAVSTPTSMATSTVISTPTLTPTSLPSSAPTVIMSASEETSGLSLGAKVGIGIAVPILALALVALGAFLAMRHRRRNRENWNRGSKDGGDTHSQTAFAHKPELHGDSRQMAQLHAMKVAEIEGGGVASELEVERIYELDGGFRGRELTGPEAAHEKD